MEQIQDPKPKKLKVLHESLVRDKYDVPTDYDVFERNLLDEKKSQTLHQALVSAKYDVPVDYSSFAKNLEVGSFAKKKSEVGSEDVTTTGQPTSPKREEPFILSPEAMKRAGQDMAATLDQHKGKSEEQLRSEFTNRPEVIAKKVIKEIQDGKELPGDFMQMANDPGAALTQMVGSFNKAVVSSASSLPKSVAIMAKPLDDYFGTGEKDKKTEDYTTYKAGKWLDDKALEWGITATDKDKDQSFWQSTVPGALGSVAAIVLTGGRSTMQPTAALEQASMLPTNIVGNAVKNTAEILTSPGAVMGSTAMAVPEFENAKKAGMSDDEAFDVWAKNYFVGTTEILPIQSALNRINKMSGGKLVDIVKAGLPGGFEEGIQETVQQVLTNKIAQGSYDPTRDTFKDVATSAGAGFFVGFILPGIGAAMKSMSPEQRTETQEIINKQLKDVQQSTKKIADEGVQAEPIESSTAAVETPVEETGTPTPVADVASEQRGGIPVLEPAQQVEPQVQGEPIPEIQAVEESTEPVPNEETETQSVTEPIAEVKEEEKVPVPEEKSVNFTWLDIKKKGVVVETKENGSLKVRAEDGTLYTVKPEMILPDAPMKKKVKVSVASTERKIAKLKDQILKSPEHLTVDGRKITVITDHGAKMITQMKNLKERLQRLQDKQYGAVQASPDKSYEVPIGMAKRSKNGRLSVSPIIGGKPKQLKDIMLDLSKSKPGTIYYTKSPAKGRRALGAYYPSMGTTGIKFKNDLDVTAHETGHELDDRFGILETISNSPRVKDIEVELKELSKFGSKPPKGHQNKKKYRQGEGMAEYIRAYLVNPVDAEKKFPATTEWIKQVVPAEVLASVNKFGTDIRTFAGLSAHDQVMSNVQFEPEKKKGTILEFFKPRGVSKDFKVTWVDKLGYRVTNDRLYFEKSVRFLEQAQGQKLSPENDPTMLARVYLGANEKIDNIFEKGLVTDRNVRIVDPVSNKHMSLEWLLAPFDNVNADAIKKEQQETISYMIAERTIELSTRFNREDVLTGIGGGIFKDTDVAAKRIMEFQASPKEKQDRIFEAARRYRVYADNVLRYMVDKGRMSEEQYDLITKDNTQYVALQRILEAAPGEEIVAYQSKSGNSSVGSSKNVIKKIKGSAAQIQNPYESLVETTVKAIKESDRNEVVKSFRDLFEYTRSMYQGQPNYTGVIARPATSGDKNTIKVFVDGKEEYWQLQPDVYTSIKNIIDTPFIFHPIFTALPRLLRWTVTTFPVFALRNRIRDVQQRMIVSNTRGYNGYDIYFDKKTKALTKDLYQLFGGGQSGYYLMNDDFYYKKLDEAIKELSQDKKTILSIPSKIADGYGNLLSSGERATRLEEYRSSFKEAKTKGMDDYNASIYAAYKSRDLLDFSVGGQLVKMINQVFPFTNAAVQGLRKTIRTAADDPGGFALRLTIYAIIPALINRILVHLADKDEEYEQFPSYRRDLFYNIPMGPDIWLSIPKPFELGVLSSSSERLLSKYQFGEEGALDGYAHSLMKSVLPVDDAMFGGPLKPIIEPIANYDFFRDKTIIPPDQVGLDLDLRDTSKASRFGQGIQQAIGVDGRFVDHIVKGTTSYYGDLGLRISDLGKDETRWPVNWSLTGLVRNDPLYDSKNVQKVFEHVRTKGIHWSDPFYQDLNMMISTYYQTSDPAERAKIGKEVRSFAGTVLKAYQTDDIYKRENQVLEE